MLSCDEPVGFCAIVGDIGICRVCRRHAPGSSAGRVHRRGRRQCFPENVTALYYKAAWRPLSRLRQLRLRPDRTTTRVKQDDRICGPLEGMKAT